MAFLKPDKIRNEYGLEICEKIIPWGSKNKPNKLLKNGKVEWITIHNTDDIQEASGTNDAEQYARSTHNGNMKGVSVHYYVDESGCWQILSEEERGYHAADGPDGPGNGTSLAVEIVMDGSGKWYDVQAEDRGALLAAILLHRHGLGIDRLTTHYRWYPAKFCPAYILPHWSKFRDRVQGYLTKIEAGGFESDGGIWKVQIGAFSDEEKAKAFARFAKEKGLDAVVVKQIRGDVDGDGKVTATDAREALRIAVGLEE